MKNHAVLKWIIYIVLIVACTAVGGDLGLLAAIALIYMMQD